MELSSRVAADPRRLTCAGCGSTFACGLGGDCWCAAETYRLPLPVDGMADCLCPTCLRAAVSQDASTPKR